MAADLITVEQGLKLAELAQGIIHGRQTNLATVRSVIDGILASEGPIGDLASALTHEGEVLADAAADAAEDAKAGP